MRTLRNCLVALVLGISAPALIWVGAGAALVQSRKKSRHFEATMVCSMDNDCPPNYVCVEGRCVPAKSFSA